MTGGLRALVGLVGAAAACFVASWTLLPAPTYGLLTLGVGAPEAGPWVALFALLALALALGAGQPLPWTARLAVPLALLAVALALHPLLRLPAVARRFDAAVRETLGGDPLARVSPARQATMRPRRVLARDLFLGVRTGESVVTRGVPVASPGGVPLSADVYRPPGGTGRPVLVQLYGGAWQRGAPANDPTLARWLAARGWVVVAVDYRHAPAWRWPAQLDDVRAMLRWTRAHAADFGGDASRLALLGRSAGGHLALMAAYTTPAGEPPPQAVVSFYGPTDLVGGWREPPSPDPMNARLLEETLIGGTPAERPEAYRDASPVTWADRPQPPTLLVYGGRDHVVSPGWGRALHARLRAAGNTSLLLEVPWAEHAFDAVPFGPSAQLALYETERFLEWAVSPRP